MSCLLYEFCVMVVIVLTQFESCLPTNGRTPTTNRPRRKISPYTAHKLTSIHVPRGIKTRDPSTRAVKAALYRPNHKINLEQTRDESRKGELSQFPHSTKPIKSSFALYVRRIATQDNSNCVHQDTLHKDSRSQTLTLPCGFWLPFFPLQYQELINYSYFHGK